MMLPLYFTCLVLCSHALLSYGAPSKCNETQYSWPIESSRFCCNMCPPGRRMGTPRAPDSCDIKCEVCQKDQYRDTYNVEMRCLVCTTCDEENMVVKSNCNATHNAVCTCKDRYRCKDKECSACELIPTTTKPTLPLTTTALKPAAVTTQRTLPIQMSDTAWFLVITALLCSGIALVLVTKIKPFLRWTRSVYGYFLAEKQEYTEDNDMEDNDMPKPVQEVCGKCDQPIEV